MQAAVIYKSKTGFTKKYAEWIAEELQADLFSADEMTVKRMEEYDTIIYGGSLYAVGIKGVGLITKNIERLKGKKIVVFATGASPVREEVIEEVKNKNFTPEQQKIVQFFYLRGGFDYKKLGFFDKFLMTLLKWKMQNKKKEELSDDEIGMLAVYDKTVDYTEKKKIEKILMYVNS